MPSLQMELWTAEHGLAHNTVLTLAQSPDGYLWVGTWEGLQRFDGSRFRLPEGAPAGVVNAGVLTLAVDPEGSLWVGNSRGGLFQLHRGVWRTHVEPDTALERIAVLLPDRDDNLWIGTANGRLLRLRDGVLATLPIEGGSPGSIDGLAISRDGQRVAISNIGVLAIDIDRARRVDLDWPEGLPVLLRVVPRGDRGFQLATSRGLLQLETDPWRVRAGAYRQPVSRILETAAGDLWLGTDPQQLTRLRDGRIESLGRADGLPSDRVGALMEDHEGNVWVGTNAGLIRLRESPFIAITAAHGLRDRYVRSLLELPDGRVVASSAGGLNLIENYRAVTPPASWPAALIQRSTLALTLAADGRLLVGTTGDGAWELSPTRTRQRRAPAELGADHVRAMAVGPDGRVWYGSIRGLSSCLGTDCRHYGPAEGLSGSAIMAVEFDPAGRLWVSSPQGVNVGEGGQFVSIPFVDGLPRTAFAFLTDRSGRRWLATENGLGLVIDGRIHLLDDADGLVDDAVFAILEDRDGQLWVSSNRGLQRFDPGQAVEVFAGRQRRLQGRIFRRADGLPLTQANGASQPSAMQSRDGRLWFATAGGIAVVDPAEVREERLPPPPRALLDTVRIDGVDQHPGATIQLRPGQQRLQFQFNGISFVAPERLQLRYRLSGFDADWQLAGNERLASYTNLAPGRYTFLLEAGWAEVPDAGQTLRLLVEVLPAWHQQSGARVLLTLLALLGLAGAIRLRVRGLRRRALMLQQQIDRKTADLKAERDALDRANRRNAELAEQLGRHAREDALTGLANRREADRVLAELLAAGPTLIALLDLDHFKRINDELGHAVGDQALQTLARALQSLDPPAALAARIGGEEFLLAEVGTRSELLLERLDGLRSRLLDSACAVDPAVPPLRFSAGVAAISPGESAASALRRADAALYAAKAAGRDRSIVAG